MLKTLNIVRSIAVVSALTAAWALPTAAVAQKNSVPWPATAAQQNQAALAQNQAPQLFQFMPADRGGNVFRQRPTGVSVAQPNRFDSTQSGSVNVANVKEQTQVNLPARSSLLLGK